MRPVATLAAVLLGIVALAHVYRLIKPFEVVIAGHFIGQWVSVVGALVAGVVSIMLWRESRG